MVRNLFFLIIGAFGGILFIWPQIITTKGWECTKDIISSSDEELTDIDLPTIHGDFSLKLFEDKVNGDHHLAIIKGSWNQENYKLQGKTNL